MEISNHVKHFITASKQAENPFNPELQAKLILEEAVETIDALGFHAQVKLSGEWEVHKKNNPDGSPVGLNVVEMIDGLCDVVYVCYHAFEMYTAKQPVMITFEDFLLEVCNNNSLKVANPKFDETGKLIKPEDHPKPDIEYMVRKYLVPENHHPSNEAIFVVNTEMGSVYLYRDIYELHTREMLTQEQLSIVDTLTSNGRYYK